MRVPHCQACANEKFGLRTRLPVKHICPKSDKNYQPAETQTIGTDIYYKVFYNQITYQTGKATKFQLTAKQWINNYKVTFRNSELWIPDWQFHNPNTHTQRSALYIWVKKEFYDQMAFV